MTDHTTSPTIYRVVIDRVGHNHAIAPLLTTDAGPEGLTEAIVRHSRRYRDGALWLDLLKSGDGWAGHFHQQAGDNLGDVTVSALTPQQIHADLSGEGLLAAAARAAAAHQGDGEEIVAAATVCAVLSHLQRHAHADGSDVVTGHDLARLGRAAAQLLIDHDADPAELIPLDGDGLPLQPAASTDA